MWMKEKRMTYPVVIALLVCLLAGLTLPRAAAWAKGYIDVDKTCSLSVVSDSEWKELNEATLTVSLYRIASVDADGAYTATEDFADLDVGQINAASSAKELQELAVGAKEIAAAAHADRSFSVAAGSGTADALATGLYLILTDDYESAEYVYEFAPSLIALPSDETGLGDGTKLAYENVIVALKPERVPLTGELEITKILKRYNNSLGKALFVFDVEAEKDGKKVYSDVVSLSFSEAGKKTTTITELPAGAEVTVTEIYSGASYRLTTEASRTVTIPSGSAGKATVSFTNEYDDTLTYGTGVVNHFEGDGAGHFTWSQLSDNE